LRHERCHAANSFQRCTLPGGAQLRVEIGAWMFAASVLLTMAVTGMVRRGVAVSQ
jgi:hypothetical protein